MPQKKILIIEDDLDVSTGLQFALTHEGYLVEIARDGKEAMDYLKANHNGKEGTRVDLIYLDLMMPVMDGWEFLQAKNVNDLLRPIPVVVLSAILPTSLSIEGVFFQKKPIELKKLLDLTRRFCG